ncbi:hypothetical protein ACFL1Y_01975, partial [Patescibacteria group bacterium]
MLIEIIPATRLPRKISSFTYKVPPEFESLIKVGQIVEINLRNKNTTGLIIKIQKQNSLHKFKIKEINKILFPQPLITSTQIKLIQYMADSCGISPAIVVKSLLPDVPKKQKNIKTINQKNTKAKKQKNSKTNYFWYENEKIAIDFIKKKITKNKGQILILVPEKSCIDYLIKKLNLTQSKVIKNYAQIAKVKFFKNYLEILSKKNKIIIGTKISVLLPFSNLQKIIVWDEQNWNHKQSEINPRFDAREIATWIKQEHKSNLTYLSPAPSVEKYSTINQKIKKTKKQKNKINIINLQTERLKGNYSFLSDELIHNIQATLKKNKKIFIFHNRKGLANYIFCDDCGQIFKCPECQISLTYHLEDKLLHCHHCNYKTETPPLCPKCSKANIKFKGQGAEKIELEIKKEFKNIKNSKQITIGTQAV